MSLNDPLLFVVARKGVWHKTNPFSRIKRYLSEGLISDYKEKMDVLRQVDNDISVWTDDLDQLVQGAEKSFRNARLVDMALYLNQINQRLLSIISAGKRVEEVSEKALHEFEKEREMDLPLPEMSSQAGIFSDWKRQWLAKKLQTEKRIERNKALKKLLDLSRQVVNGVKSQLDTLSEHRHTGEIGKYLDGIHQISRIQNNFQKQFSPIYQEYLQPLLTEVIRERDEEKELGKLVQEELVRIPRQSIEDPSPNQINIDPSTNIEEKEEKALESAKVTPTPVDLGTLEVPAAPTSLEKITPTQPSPIQAPIPSSGVVEKSLVGPPTDSFPATEPYSSVPPNPQIIRIKPPVAEQSPNVVETTEEKEEKAPLTTRSGSVALARSHRIFFQDFCKLATLENPGLLAGMLTAYSAKLEDVDFNTSMQLLAIAEGLLES